MTSSPQVVVGATVAAMAAVERLGDDGTPVRWLRTGRPGGAFAPLVVRGRRLGLGLRLIEREYVAGENDRIPPPMAEHVPGHAGHRPWMGLVEDYLCDLVPDLRPAPTPLLVRNRHAVEDFALTSRLAALPGLFDVRQLTAMTTEAAAARERSGHDAGILAPPGPGPRVSLRDASISNHGRTFHDLVVEPLAGALLPGGSATVEAIQRHKVWAPIYWPSTLWEAASLREPSFDPQRTFWTDAAGGMSDVVTALARRIDDMAHVQTVDPGRLLRIAPRAGGAVFHFEDGHVEEAIQPIVGTSPTEVFTAAGQQHRPERVRMRFAWADAPEHAVRREQATTFLDGPVFRATAGPVDATADGQRRRSFALEVRHDARITPAGAAAVLHATGYVSEPGAVRVMANRTLDAFVAPTIANRRLHERNLARFRECHPDLMLIGGAAAHGADPLNEQLFGGLRAAREVSGAHV